MYLFVLVGWGRYGQYYLVTILQVRSHFPVSFLQKIAGHLQGDFSICRIFPREKQVQVIVFACYFSPCKLFLERRSFRLIYSVAIAEKPVAHLLQHFFLKVNYCSVSLRTYVQQVISSSGNHINQAPSLFAYLIFYTSAVLPCSVSPGLIEHGCGTLPGSMKGFVRIVIVGHYAEIILVIAQASAHHAVGLVLVYEFIQFLTLCRGICSHVKPEFGNLSIIGQELL